jgi:hypothetical protein
VALSLEAVTHHPKDAAVLASPVVRSSAATHPYVSACAGHLAFIRGKIITIGLNMELNHQSLYGLLCVQQHSLTETTQLPPPPSPSH